MFGFEFAEKQKHHVFPQYNISMAVEPGAIEKISPLVWQEHCVECAMPACYKTCLHYKKRIDGRCRLFKYGIEKFENNDAILGQNVVIDMNEWAKIETFFFTSGLSYECLLKINKRVNGIGRIAQIVKNGKLRRFCYYVKEYYTRKIGDQNGEIPQYFLCEIVNEDKPYTLNLENRAAEQIVYRTSLKVNKGFNRFWIPTKEFNYYQGYRNNLLIYPDGNAPQLVNIVSLELVSLKENFLEKYFPSSSKKVKCVVWDLDHTIWNGILGEDGIDGITVREDIVEIIKELDRKGILNSISSKNYEDKAVEALKKYGIYEYFVSPMIDWNAKSENIKMIASILDINIDTFVFVDDSFFELNEVKQNCPGIRVCNVSDIQEYIKQDFFNVPVTEEGKKRRMSYKEIAVRNKAAADFKDNIAGFLKKCNMIMHISHPGKEDLMRCYELVQRTNQLNISGERLTFEQIKHMTESKTYECYRIKVNDNFGDYGLVGFAVFDISDKYTVVLKHFVFSCRAARKKMEQEFFGTMINVYREQGFQRLKLICRVTEKNQLMRQVLEESGLFTSTMDRGDGFSLEHIMDEDIYKSQIATIIFD